MELDLLPIFLLFKGNNYLCPNRELICENGGTCQVQGGQPYCVCPEGYEGKQCLFSSSNSSQVMGNTTGS